MFFGPPQADTSTPQKTLQAFVSAINRKDRLTMEALVHNSKSNPDLEAAMKEEKDAPTISISKIHIKSRSSTQVVATYQLNARPQKGKAPKPRREQIDLVKVGGKWLIAVSKPQTKLIPDYLPSVAFILANPELWKRSQQSLKGIYARHYLDQIAIGAMMCIEDDDGKILIKPEDYKKTLYPYVRDPKPFTSPLDKPGTLSFSFNGNLTGRDKKSIQDPENTVMFFEGKPGELNFRYDGKAVVAFCDGRVRLVTPAEAKKLLWK